MESNILGILAPLLDFVLYFGTALLLLLLFCSIYAVSTPYPEMQLIRQGKVAPVLSYAGAVLGFVLPLSSVIVHSVSLLDMWVWAFIALIVQLAVFQAFRFFFSDLMRQIPEDRVAAGATLGLFHFAVGLINAASMSYGGI